jgi:quercetin dioxygenase-like cupin family protein
VVVVIEGELQSGLDDGEVRTLKAGDSIVQRGTTHTWKNVTPDDGLVKAVIVTYDIQSQAVEGKKDGQ